MPCPIRADVSEKDSQAACAADIIDISIAGDGIRRAMATYSLEEPKVMKVRAEFVPTRADAPEYEPDEEFCAKARIVGPPKKVTTHIQHGDEL